MTTQTSTERSIKPFTAQEMSARIAGATYLGLAQSYRMNGDILNAVACCLEGQAHAWGISRPLAVRDQLDDLLRLIDADGAISASIRNSICCATHASIDALPGIRPVIPRYRYLERLVSAQQLLDYPSEYPAFNEAYEQALSCLRNALIDELYVIQYEPATGSGAKIADPRFSFVPAALISEQGPFFS